MADYPYAVRIYSPVYDDRDAIVGQRSRLLPMRYGTVAGALAGMFLLTHEEEAAEPWDARTNTRIPDADLLRARGLNAPRFVGSNDKDSLPF